MKVFLLKSVEKIGIAGEIVKVADGFGHNYLIPRKLGVEVTPDNEQSFKNRIKVIENRKEAVATATSMLAQKIKSLKLTIQRKVHMDAQGGATGKLYGSINPIEIVELLAEQGVSISKSQVVIDKSIKEVGTYDVVVKLSSRLQPAFNLKVIAQDR